MPESGVARKIFSWDATIKGAWVSEVEDTFMRIGASDIFQNVSTVRIPLVKEALFNAHQIRWSQDILCKPKLRTFAMIKKKCYRSEVCLCSFIQKTKIIMCPAPLWDLAPAP